MKKVLEQVLSKVNPNLWDISGIKENELCITRSSAALYYDIVGTRSSDYEREFVESCGDGHSGKRIDPEFVVSLRRFWMNAWPL